MLTCLAFHRANQRQAESLCRIIAKLGGVSRHKMMLCVDEGGIADGCKDILQGAFAEVSIFVAHERLGFWPARENALLYHTANQINYTLREPWLRIEPDSLPTRASWLDEIEAEYKAFGKLVLSGSCERGNRLSGCCVFPQNLCDCSIAIMMPNAEPWYVAAFAQLTKHCAVTKLMSDNMEHAPALRVRANTEAPTGTINRHCIVQLGRLGDILNILPLVRHIWQKDKTKPVLMLHEDYKDIAEGLEYCDVEVWNRGWWSDLGAAVDDARGKYNRVTITQIHGDRWQTERKSASFCIESWRTAGADAEFGKHPLVLARDVVRESRFALEKNVADTRPIVLVSLKGTSSPFSQWKTVMDAIPSERFKVIDLSQIKAERLQDFLALYRMAALLITIDTATLHLAEASDIPVIALIADKPLAWHGSTPKGNAVLTLRYGEFERRIFEFQAAIAMNRRGVKHPPIHHVFQAFDGSGDAKRRNAIARETWQTEYRLSAYTEHPVTELPRNSESVLGDARALPFVKDMIDAGCDGAEDEEFVMLTNTDTCLRKGITHEIHRLTGRAYFSHRYDHAKLERPLAFNEITSGKWYPGSDLFVMRAGWWREFRDKMPDMLLGAEGWDKILRTLIKDFGGGEIHTCCYHELHNTHWAADRATNVSNRWNRILARKFLTERGHSLDELAQFDDAMPEVKEQKAAEPAEKEAAPVIERKLGRKGRRRRKRAKATPEQHAILCERLAKARAVRAAKAEAIK